MKRVLILGAFCVLLFPRSWVAAYSMLLSSAHCYCIPYHLFKLLLLPLLACGVYFLGSYSYGFLISWLSHRDLWMCECVYMCWARKILCAGCPGLPTLMFELPKLLTEKPVGLLPGTRELECTFEQNLAENPVGLPQSGNKKPEGLLVSKNFFRALMMWHFACKHSI